MTDNCKTMPETSDRFRLNVLVVVVHSIKISLYKFINSGEKSAFFTRNMKFDIDIDKV
jgi:hypothetical protein